MIGERYGYATFENPKTMSNPSSPYIEDFNKNKTEESIQTLNNEIEELTPIQQFYDGANVLITGATGFLGKILVEKLLRSCPTISTLYLLVRNKKGKSIDQRIDDLFDDVIFDEMKRCCPKFKHKIFGINGDCAMPELAISEQERRMLIDQVDIVFHVAATVRFDEPIKTAVAINVRAPRDLLHLSKQMKHMKVFMHVSTVFGNCLRKTIEERIYTPAIDGQKLILITETVPDHILNNITPNLLGDYPNTYAFTKQIAEDLVQKESIDLPVAIFRPAIVISTYKEPIEAWINNMYGPTGVCAGAGVGLIRILHCDHNVNANLVPVDMCVNSLIAAAWETGEEFAKAKEENKSYEIPIYNYESSTDRPITWGKYMQESEKYGIEMPSTKAVWYYSFNLCKYYSIYLLLRTLLHFLPALLVDMSLVVRGQKPKLISTYKKIHKFASVISYFSIRDWNFTSDRVRHLQNKMSERDREIFFSDLKRLDWARYFKKYLRGIRVYLLQDPIESLEEAKKQWRWYYIAHQFLKIFFILIGIQILYWLIKTL